MNSVCKGEVDVRCLVARGTFEWLFMYLRMAKLCRGLPRPSLMHSLPIFINYSYLTQTRFRVFPESGGKIWIRKIRNPSCIQTICIRSGFNYFADGVCKVVQNPLYDNRHDLAWIFFLKPITLGVFTDGFNASVMRYILAKLATCYCFSSSSSKPRCFFLYCPAHISTALFFFTFFHVTLIILRHFPSPWISEPLPRRATHIHILLSFNNFFRSYMPTSCP